MTGYTYDANGNLTVEPYTPSNNNYGYDGENRMVTFSSGGTSATYTYDGNNLRVKKQFSGTTTVYIFSGQKVVAEYVNGAAPGSPTKEYVYAGPQLLATIATGTTTYHHPDHLSARLNSNASGTKVGDQGHFPFGENWYLTNTTTKWQFTSYERDSETGNDYAISRYHMNRVGRFSSPDPIGGLIDDPQSWNRYAYVQSDPINAADPLGLEMCLDGICGFNQGISGSAGGGWGYINFASARFVTFDYDNPFMTFGLFPSGEDDMEPDHYALEWALCTYLGMCGGGSGVNGSKGGNAGSAQQRIKDAVNQALQENKLADCLNQIFGLGNILNNQNLPYLDTTKNQSYISQITATQGAQGAQAQPVPQTGKGTVLIPTELFYSSSTSMKFLSATFIHETGNILAYQRFTNVPYNQRPYQVHAQNPRVANLDPDVGAALEGCVYGGLVQPNGSIFQ